MKEKIKYWIGLLKCMCNHIHAQGKCYIGIDVKIVNRGKITIGNNCIIRPSTGIYTHTPNSTIEIAENVEIGNHSTIASLNKVNIRGGVLTGPHVYIADHNHEYENPHIPIYRQGARAHQGDRVLIDSGTWIGTNVVIVGNVHIGKNCVIGANSVVTKNIPDYSVAAGIPCKVIKKYDFDKKEWIKIES